jgi:UDP-glucose 4-epimerase
MTNNGRSPVVLVTGGCGYIGSQLIRDLVQDPRLPGVTIRILDNMQRGVYAALMDLPKAGQYQFLEGDILDPTTGRRALDGVVAVVHLAAIVKTPFSFDHPAWTEQINHWGTAQLVEHCLQANVQRFIYASSASVYGPGGPFDEDSVCRPVGPYAQSKLKAERAVLSAVERGLRPTVLRLGTVYGYAPSMRFEAVADRFGYLAGIGRPLTVYGTGEQQRPLVHVRDASEAIRFCLSHEAETSEHIYNVSHENASVLDLVRVIQEIKPNIPVHYTEQDIFTHFSFALDSHRIEQLGLLPQYDLRRGLAEVIGRFRSFSAMKPLISDLEDDV